jgi:hypothetical protein
MVVPDTSTQIPVGGNAAARVHIPD